VTDHAAQEAAQQRPDHAQRRRQEQAHALPSRHDGARKEANEQTKNQKPQ
jgi:hypothetical protein